MTKTSTCAQCGVRIILIQTGFDSFSWVAAQGEPGDPVRWKCKPTREFPLRGHEPVKDVTDVIDIRDELLK